ncbi:OLC1v1014880C1 [Oldenlandia corymbosa var. corymbosa]|uniref:OLC1v1014880C1 n=1 Tax=Oldenlandia corymbosa var. corymbosa TaxID=529605 RepID=A0AAV1E1Z6_OLDCO|nr:OLC1v1014880C1 [Oldenlandia corymbosa var. corymbosa]
MKRNDRRRKKNKNTASSSRAKIMKTTAAQSPAGSSKEITTTTAQSPAGSSMEIMTTTAQVPAGSSKEEKETEQKNQYVDKGTPEAIQALVAEALQVTAKGHLGEAKNEVILRLVDCVKWHKHQRDLLDWAAAKPVLEPIAEKKFKDLLNLTLYVAQAADSMTATVKRMRAGEKPPVPPKFVPFTLQEQPPLPPNQGSGA